MGCAGNSMYFDGGVHTLYDTTGHAPLANYEIWQLGRAAAPKWRSYLVSSGTLNLNSVNQRYHQATSPNLNSSIISAVLPRVGPGADLGLQAVSLQATKW